jgi:predicted amidohydrolase
MKAAVAQIDCVPGDVAANLQMLGRLIEKAARERCDVVMFPEMSDVGYDMPRIVQSATRWSDGSYAVLAESAKKYGIAVVVGLAERENARVYNTIAVIGRGGELLCKYRKVHLVTTEPIREHEFLAPGSELALCELEGLRCGFMTCYDIRFPELARALTLHGAELIVAPSAFPLVRIEHWRVITTCRAIENQVYVAAPNRVGTDAGIVFGGVSRVVDPYGVAIGSMSEIDTGLLTVEVSVERVREVRSRAHVLRDRREDLYRSWRP